MPLPPPLLEIYVVWHPDDEHLGRPVFEALYGHFHGPTFAGLAGGAVEVYLRSEGWQSSSDPPRPLPAGDSGAFQSVVLPIVGVGLVRAVETDEPWRTYLQHELLAPMAGDASRLVIPLRVGLTGDDALPDEVIQRSIGEGLKGIGAIQSAKLGSTSADADFCAQIAQAITQHLSEDGTLPLTVFISHTKGLSAEEFDAHALKLFSAVRQQLATTRLRDFFDERDLQLGQDFAEALDAAAAGSAFLMVRTDRYAEREWTQREVLTAKRADVPAVALYGLRAGEERGSFLMDHMPAVPCDVDAPFEGIREALNRLVDEALKRALWLRQTVYIEEHGFDWLPVRSPEPSTLSSWLIRHRAAHEDDTVITVMHPDPPLGMYEREVLEEICQLAGYEGRVEILTPRTFAARGGRLAR